MSPGLDLQSLGPHRWPSQKPGLPPLSCAFRFLTKSQEAPSEMVPSFFLSSPSKGLMLTEAFFYYSRVSQEFSHPLTSSLPEQETSKLLRELHIVPSTETKQRTVLAFLHLQHHLSTEGANVSPRVPRLEANEQKLRTFN